MFNKNEKENKTFVVISLNRCIALYEGTCFWCHNLGCFWSPNFYNNRSVTLQLCYRSQFFTQQEVPDATVIWYETCTIASKKQKKMTSEVLMFW